MDDIIFGYGYSQVVTGWCNATVTCASHAKQFAHVSQQVFLPGPRISSALCGSVVVTCVCPFDLCV